MSWMTTWPENRCQTDAHRSSMCDFRLVVSGRLRKAGLMVSVESLERRSP
jgi:hypothetical protein